MTVVSINIIPDVAIDDVVALAVGAEAIGFERCWVYDEGIATRDVYVTLAAIADATDRLHIGPGITNPYTRHPAQTASAVATLAELSGGRAFLGIGAGGSLTLDPICVARTRPLTAVAETIAACRSLFAGESVDQAGEIVRLDHATLANPDAGIEIWLAGRGPRMLQLGGEHADGVLLDFIHRDFLADSVRLIVEAGADRSARLAYSTAVVLTDADLEVVRPHMTYRLVDAPPRVQAALGMRPDDVDAIRSAMAGGLEEAAAHVHDNWVTPFVIHGSEAECRAQLADLVARHGFEEFVVPVFDTGTGGDHLGRVSKVLEAGL